MKVTISAAFALLVVTTMPAAAGDESAPPLSPAQMALFESDHLKSIDHPERLEYRFQHESGDAAHDYTDRVLLDVRPRPDGLKDVWVDFLSGPRHHGFPPMMGFRGNPALMFFLERDVEEMRRATGGAAAYFRNRIRRAFVDEAQVAPAEIPGATAGGSEGTRKATQITLAPFRGDERLALFPGVADKVYRFLLSDAVPGTIYSISTEIPAAGGHGPVSESMVFAATEPCAAAEGPCSAPERK